MIHSWKQIYQKMVQIMILRYVSSWNRVFTPFSVIILNFKSLLITETYKLQGETIISLVAMETCISFFGPHFVIPSLSSASISRSGFFSKVTSWYKLNHGYRYNIKLFVSKLQLYYEKWWCKNAPFLPFIYEHVQKDKTE